MRTPSENKAKGPTLARLLLAEQLDTRAVRAEMAEVIALPDKAARREVERVRRAVATLEDADRAAYAARTLELIESTFSFPRDQRVIIASSISHSE